MDQHDLETHLLSPESTSPPSERPSIFKGTSIQRHWLSPDSTFDNF